MQLKCNLLLLLWLAQAGYTQTIKQFAEEDIFGNTEHIDPLLQMEKNLYGNMMKYVEALKLKFDIISNATRKLEAENLRALQDPDKYLGNPLKAFSLIRRLNADWNAWLNYMTKPVGEVYMKEMKAIIHELQTDMEVPSMPMTYGSADDEMCY